MLVTDQLHRAVVITSVPKRIISLVPSQTELLVDLGLEACIVGITKFCVHPVYLRSQKAVVGGTKQVSVEKISALRPDIIICNKEENTEAIVIELEAIAPVWVSNIYSVADTLSMVQSLGEIFEVHQKASSLIDDINKDHINFKRFMQNKPIKKVAYLIWKNPWMLAGTNTFINELLLLNNFENIAAVDSRYPEVDIDVLHQADLVLLSTEPFPFKEEDAFNLRNILSTEVRLVDGEFFSWYGSRIRNAFSYFKTLH